jgi:hypothetical protein
MRPGGGRPLGPGGPGPGEGPGGPDGTASQVQDTAVLMELTVYGIATLYERFPPKPKSAESTTPTTPAK